MPEWVTGVISIFKNEIFSVKYMLIILIWLCGLALLPDSVRVVFEEKVKIPYAFEITVFAFSVLASNFFVFTCNQIKKISSLKREYKKRNEMVSILNSLNEEENNVISYLLNSGYSSITCTADPLPQHILSLLRKEVIFQIGEPDGFGACCFYLEDEFASLIKECTKKIYLNKK